MTNARGVQRTGWHVYLALSHSALMALLFAALADGARRTLPQRQSPMPRSTPPIARIIVKPKWV